MSDQAGILPKWFSNWGIILAKGQFDHSNNFWTMPILIFSPVQIIMGHPLQIVTTCSKDMRVGSDTFCDHFIEKIFKNLLNERVAEWHFLTSWLYFLSINNVYLVISCLLFDAVWWFVIFKDPSITVNAVYVKNEGYW